jgi:hypothetical protein
MARELTVNVKNRQIIDGNQAKITNWFLLGCCQNRLTEIVKKWREFSNLLTKDGQQNGCYNNGTLHCYYFQSLLFDWLLLDDWIPTELLITLSKISPIYILGNSWFLLTWRLNLGWIFHDHDQVERSWCNCAFTEAWSWLVIKIWHKQCKFSWDLHPWWIVLFEITFGSWDLLEFWNFNDPSWIEINLWIFHL